MTNKHEVVSSDTSRTSDTGCENVPDLIEPNSNNVTESSSNQHGLSSSNDSLSQNLPHVPPSNHEEDAPKQKRNPAIRGAIVIGKSLSNTVDDHFFRGIRPSSPANKVFIQRFLMPTIKDTLAVLEPNELIEKHRYIDESQLPFKELMLQVKGVTQEKIDANQDILLSCLAFATFSVFLSLYKLFYFSLSIFMSDISTTFAQWVSLALWVAFFMFSISVYISFAYHNWIIERDRFGTGGMFLRDFLNGEREAIFPYKFARKYL